MPLPMRLGHYVRVLRVLIDRGAQAKFVRTGIFPHHEWERSAKLIRLTTVRAVAMSGGMLIE